MIRRRSARLRHRQASPNSSPSVVSPNSAAISTTTKRRRPSSSSAAIPSELNHADAAASSSDHIRWLRFQANGLAGGHLAYSGYCAIARALVGVQAQELNSGLLAIWQRLPGGASAFDHADVTVSAERPSSTSAVLHLGKQMLANGGGLVRIWGQRCTLHLYDRSDWPVVSAAFVEIGTASCDVRFPSGPSVERIGRRALFDAAMQHARKTLLEGPSSSRLTRLSLVNGLDDGLRYGVFMQCGYEGVGCRIDIKGGLSMLAPRAFAAPDLAWKPPAFTEALFDMARRYFAAYGPASEDDVRYFLAIPAAHSKAVVKRLLEEDIIQTFGGDSQRKQQYVLASSMSKVNPPERWPVRLLGRFDPLLLAHRDKSCWIDAKLKSRVWSNNAHIRSTVLVRGQIVGLWEYTLHKKLGLSVTIQVFPEHGPLTKSIREAIRRQAEGIANTFFGTTLRSVDYDDDHF